MWETLSEAWIMALSLLGCAKRQKPLQKNSDSVYLGENVTPLGFFHLYQTSIDIVVIFLMKFNPTVVN